MPCEYTLKQLTTMSENLRAPDAVIVNAKSRSGPESEQIIREFFASKEIAEPKILTLKSVGEFRKELKELVSQKAATVWVAGGDGTIREAAQILKHSETTLGILPMGTGNSLARELGIPLDIAKAAELFLEESEVRNIDVGQMDEETFVNVVTLGLTTRIAESVKKSPKRTFGRLVYLPSVWKALHEIKPFQIKVETPTSLYEGPAIQFVAASSRLHGGPFAVTKNASMDDGVLSMYVVTSGDRATLLRYAVSLILGGHVQFPEIWTSDDSCAVVSLKESRKFVVDGDEVRKNGTKLTVATRALSVLCPPSAQE